MPGYVAGAKYQILDNSTQSTAFYVVLFRGTVLQGFLANHAKKIVGEYSKFHYQTICGELAGWQAFYIHICLDFAMVLLTFTMCVIGRNYLVICPAEVRPPSIYLNIRREKYLPMLVNRALDNFIADPQAYSLPFAVLAGVSYVFP